MNVLWITNILFPQASKYLDRPSENTGGWMYSLATQLINLNGIKLAVATIYDGMNLQKFTDGKIKYYLLPRKIFNIRYDSTLEPHWIRIVKEYQPDIIHIHGTEYAHGLACMRACTDQRYVISIQGLVSVISEYHFAGIKPNEFLKYTTLSDLRHKHTILQEKKEMEKRGRNEIEYLKRSNNIIGRTTWDYVHTKSINPNAKYHFCNEVLRDSFYISPSWNVESKKNYSIFMSQAKTQHKGLHLALRAMTIIKNYYPDVKLRIGGGDITGGDKWVQRTRTYGHYIRSLIKSLQLQNQVVFLGDLKEEKMAEEFRNAHVFVSPSVIENSPNSLGEAQMIGTPCVASFVGGVPDLVKDGESGLLYRFDDFKMLAFKIMDIFQYDNLAQSLSEKSKMVASVRHERDAIGLRIIDIYKEILKQTP